MGILNEMLGDEDNNSAPYEGEFIAEGKYESLSEEILEGYKIYQKKYVFKSLALKIIIVLFAMASSIMMIMTSKENEIMPVFCLMLCIVIGIWFINQPIMNRKNLKKGLEMLEGTQYKAEFFTDKIIISDISSGEENKDTEESNDTSVNDSQEEDEDQEKDERPPATVIHLDSSIVNLLDRSDMFILVVNRSYVFIIPKRGFAEEDTEKIKEKLSNIMGVRYKAV